MRDATIWVAMFAVLAVSVAFVQLESCRCDATCAPSRAVRCIGDGTWRPTIAVCKNADGEIDARWIR